MANKAGKASFGSIRELHSKRFQASYTGPDHRRHFAPVTFDARIDAEGWLALRRSEMLRNAWLPDAEPKPAPARAVTLGDYAQAWLAGRTLSPGTRRLYRLTLDNQILPGLGSVALSAITPPMVREWHARLSTDQDLKTGPRQRAAAYSLLNTIMLTAVADDIIPASPCRVRGAGKAVRKHQIRPATLAELEQITAAMPARYRLMVLLAAWCALRFGELAELRRADVDVTAGIVRVRRGVIRTDSGDRVVKGPKSEAGKRDVNIPPHLMPMVRDHLRDHVQAGQAALLFPAANGGHMAPSSLYAVYYPARARAGRPDLRFHDLRHTGATLAAATGATLAELMARLGHSTVSAAMRYQHAAQDRDKAIAEALSKMATVTPISAAKGRRKGAAAG